MKNKIFIVDPKKMKGKGFSMRIINDNGEPSKEFYMSDIFCKKNEVKNFKKIIN